MQFCYIFKRDTCIMQFVLKKNNIRIRDIPLFLGDYAVHKLMETLNLNLTSKILYRDLCVCNLKPLLHRKHLTRINYFGSVQCNLYHFGQQKNPTNFLYRNCLKTNHKSSWRQKPVHTILPFLRKRACTNVQPQKHLTTFYAANPRYSISTFYFCELLFFLGQNKSIEHACQYI